MYGLNLLGGLAQGFAQGQQAAYDREEKAQLAEERKMMMKYQQAAMQSKIKQQETEDKLLDVLMQGSGMGGMNESQQAMSNQEAFGAGFGSEIGPPPAQGRQGLTDILATGGMHPLLAGMIQKRFNVPMLDAMKYQQQVGQDDIKNLQWMVEQGQLQRLDLGDRIGFVDRYGQMSPISIPKAMEYLNQEVTGPTGEKTLQRVPKFGPVPGSMGAPPPGSGMVTQPGPGEMPIDEDKLPLWINPQGQTPPPGTTPSQAMTGGFNRVSTNQRSMMDSMIGAETVLGRITGLMGNVFPKQGGVWERATGGAQREFGALIQMNPQAAQLKSLIAGTLAPMVRAMGEKGTLAEGDIGRAKAMMPAMTDSADVAWLKVNELREMFREIKGAMMGNAYDAKKGMPLKQLTEDKARSILAATGGDKDKARELARSMGYEF